MQQIIINRKNYFKILGVREKFELSQTLIHNKFLEKQEELRAESGPLMEFEYTELSEAYFCLKDPLLRARHIFEINGILGFKSDRLICLDSLVVPESKTVIAERFEDCFEDMRRSFREKNLIEAYEAWCSCNVLNTFLDYES